MMRTGLAMPPCRTHFSAPENHACSSSIVGRTFTMCGIAATRVNIQVMQCPQTK
jgi:hypothetical protein